MISRPILYRVSEIRTYSDFQKSQKEPVLVSEASSTGHTADQYW